ncbi:MAG: glycogen debranching protein GlgX [Gammaproteobacteria bacterium]|nr:glycogen debranching protein GlgX [Gammaproteobacteria bacterium]
MIVGGRPSPLGATPVVTPAGTGINFALWAPHAQRVELCLFTGDREMRYEMPGFHHGVWHGRLNDYAPGLRYGYRVYGEYNPAAGLRFNPNKLLLDPYARAYDSDFAQDSRLFDYVPGQTDWVMDDRDNASVMPKSVVYENHFDWQSVKPPRRPLSESVIYELHVRGFTMKHPLVPHNLRGTYLGLAQAAVIEYLQQLGVTAIELLPCASFFSEPTLTERGLSNYWGYNPVGFFAPHRGYAVDDPVVEFQTMVRAMHRAGIEVIVDVVYNHTAEADAWGPTLSFRGIENEGYYWLRTHDRSAYVNNSGCGNSLAADHPQVLRLIMDSLRYWVEVLGVDGFRFDLAPSMARLRGEYDSHAPFLQALHQDPVLNRVKLIAEPWDVGHAGYRLGQFPRGWSEWNDQYRKVVRSFWRGDDVAIGDLAARISGSSDIFHGRGPDASINYITSHDGFTLHDLVSYQAKHNEANGEDNNDGERDNRSWNRGVEGPTDDPAIVARRRRDKRNLLATLLLSQGVPMIAAGDEFGRTQQGNNNAYCQDNEISWLDWGTADAGMVDFVRQLIRLRRSNPVFQRGEFFIGPVKDQAALYDVLWLTESGAPMQIDDWHDEDRRTLSVLFRGTVGAETVGPRWSQSGHDALLLINGCDDDISFALPPPPGGGHWRVSLDTTDARVIRDSGYAVRRNSVVLLTANE